MWPRRRRKAVQPEMLPEHESAVRRLTSDAVGARYTAFRTLAEAQQDPDAAVVLEGDDGGQIYAVFPASLVKCSEAALRSLLGEVDHTLWPGSDPGSARVFFESRPIGEGVVGGMGGGLVTRDGWVHPRVCEAGLELRIRSVVTGTA